MTSRVLRCRNLGAILVTGIGIAVAAAQQGLISPEESKWFTNVRQLTNSGMCLDKSGEAYFSADGKRICFQAVPHWRAEYQIFVMNLDGSGLEMVSTGEGAT